MLRVVIVDDEPLARAMVRQCLVAHPGVEVVAECANGFEAVKAVADLSPDLLFLDVQMPKLSGFEVLELIGRDVAVIFTTAYDQYALRAFEVHAVDYLLKPFSEQRFAEALSRARERLAAKESLPVDALVSEARPRQAPGWCCALWLPRERATTFRASRGIPTRAFADRRRNLPVQSGLRPGHERGRDGSMPAPEVARPTGGRRRSNRRAGACFLR